MILRNANILNVFTGEWIGGDIKIEGGIITGIGDYSDEGDFVDIGGRSIVPGFINTHVHIESTMVTPRQYAAEILPWGTTTAIADPHEIANVAGLPGVEFMIDQSKDLPCNIYFMLPSCVPATPYDDNAIALEAEELFKLKDNPAVLGLGEMMDCPGVLNNNPEVFAKLKLFYGDKSKIIDGHAPFLSGKDLQKYRASGIITDHECSTAEEVLEKIRAGIYILAREGSSAKNVETIIKAVMDAELSDADGFGRIAFCTDDKHIRDIRENGDIAENIRKTIALGVSPAKAYKIASYNGASIYGLKNLGAVSASYQADLVVLDDVEKVAIHSVYHKGIKVSEGITPLHFPAKEVPKKFLHSINVKSKLTSNDLIVKCGEQSIDCIALVPNQILTKIHKATATDLSCPLGIFEPNSDYQKIAVIERHHATGKIGAGIVKGFSLTGAIATTVSHDSHNIIVVGDNDKDMITAVEHLKKIGGGFVLARDGEIVGDLPLPICGLMTDANTSETLTRLVEMSISAREMGVPEWYDPFITLSFLALTVIPEIRITPRGIVTYL